MSTPRLYLNLMIVMTVGGLWHGPAMTFVVWGFVHGSALVVERVLGLHRIASRPRWVRLGWYAVVQVTVLIAWVFFRSDGLDHALAYVGNIARVRPRGWVDWPVRRALPYVAPIVVMHLFGKLVETKVLPPLPRVLQAVLAALMLYGVVTFYGATNDFIYFQF